MMRKSRCGGPQRWNRLDVIAEITCTAEHNAPPACISNLVGPASAGSHTFAEERQGASGGKETGRFACPLRTRTTPRVLKGLLWAASGAISEGIATLANPAGRASRGSHVSRFTCSPHSICTGLSDHEMNEPRCHRNVGRRSKHKLWGKQTRSRSCKVLIAVASVSLIGCGGQTCILNGQCRSR